VIKVVRVLITCVNQIGINFSATTVHTLPCEDVILTSVQFSVDDKLKLLYDVNF